MSDNNLKKLFSQKSNQFLSAKSVDDLAENAESPTYIDNYITDKDKFVPPVDFNKPENFAKFGLAESYYDDSVSRVYKTYPYDGSRAEKLVYENSSSYLDRWVLETRYPKSTGYVNFNTAPNNTWPAQYNPNIKEYISFVGGPGTGSTAIATKPLGEVFSDANVYDTTKKRDSNLKWDWSGQGNTIEFWVKLGKLNPATENDTQVIFDLSNGTNVSGTATTGPSPYGRLHIYYYAPDHTPNPASGFYASVASGTIKHSLGASGIPLYTVSDGLAYANTGSWNHYAFSFKNTATKVQYKSYQNGKLVKNGLAGGPINEVTGALKGAIGALVEGTVGGSDAAGWRKMSGSIDEFRYWKRERNAEEIGRYWLSQVGGGSNSDDANTDLGVYYKFNEGIVGNTSIDSTVLDYSGRVTNGTFVGYNSTYSRNTGSAIVSASAAPFEKENPIIYPSHPKVSALLNDLKATGSAYDRTNNSSLYSSFPSWIVEDDNFTLKILSQIMSSYLDTLQLQIEHLPKIKDTTYLSSSAFKPAPFAGALLDSVGFVSPEVFVDADVLEEFYNRTNEILFDDKLHNIKNLIYQNVYNNLVHIYKSKGTEKAFRNLIRCYGIGDDLVKLNVYADKSTYVYEDNFESTSEKKNVLNFNEPNNFAATVYQSTSSSEPDAIAFISGTQALSYTPRTIEADVFFPKKRKINDKGYFYTPFVSSSLFGMHTSLTTVTYNTTWATPDVANFQVYAVKDEIESKSVRFILTSTDGSGMPDLGTGLFEDVYDNQNWNISVRVKPTKYPVSNYTSGSFKTTYDVEFTGYNNILDITYNSFSVTGSMTEAQGRSFLSSSHRVYAGSHRTNFFESVLERSDVRIAGIRYWLDYLEDDELKAHARDPINYGRKHPYRNAYPLISTAADSPGVPQKDTLTLNWDFQQVTASNAAGIFQVKDFSSGSTSRKNEAYGIFGPVLLVKHPGVGYGWPASSTDVVDVDYFYAARQSLPENVNSSDMIQILNDDEKTFTRESRPVRHFFAFEKSMYDVVSAEMLNMFSSVKDFSNLVGNPVNRYRDHYKDLTKLRSLFFDRVENTPDLDKYIDFYKWIDSSLGYMLNQLIPASADFAENVRTMVESHVLERSKYKTPFPTLDSKFGTPGENGLETYFSSHASTAAEPYSEDRAPLPPPQMENNRAVYFDGTTYFRINQGETYPWRPLRWGPSGGASHTFMAWIKTKATGTPLTLYPQRPTATPFGICRIMVASSGEFYFYDHEGTAGGFAAGTTNLADDRWHHIAYSYEYGGGANTGANDRDQAKLYTDGVLRNTGDVQIDFPTINSWAPTIGAISGAAGVPLIPFVGTMDEIAFFNTNVADAVITSQYNNGIPTSPVTGALPTNSQDNFHCTAWYRGNKNIGTSLIDYTGYGNDATSYGSPSIVYPVGLQRPLNQEKNCAWWKKRANREDPPFTGSVPMAVNQNRQTILKVAQQTYELEARRPTSLNIKKDCHIHGGINYTPEKIIEYAEDATHFQSDVVGITIAAGSFLSSSCTDASLKPSEGCHTKTRISFKATTPKSPAGIKGDIVAPFNLVEDYLVSGGYNQEVKAKLGKDVVLTNLHSDGEEIPIQGPFTDAWVGGRQFRHADITVTPKTATDGQERGEAWKLDINNTANTITFKDPIGGPSSLTKNDVSAKLFREERAKRPLNIKNIKYSTASARLGNYNKNYQVVSTTSRTVNNLAFVQSGGYSQLTPENYFLSQSGTPLSGTINFTLPSRALENGSFTKTVIASRFNAPGGKDVSSRGVLNPASEEYASMNALPWRNRVVRKTLQDDLTVHAGQFGTYPYQQYGLNFDGTNDYIEINPSDTSSMMGLGLDTGSKLKTAFSISFWIRVKPGDVDATDQSLVTIYTEAGTQIFACALESSAGFNATLAFFTNGADGFSTVALDDNEWHLCVFAAKQVTGQDYINIYLDGVDVTHPSTPTVGPYAYGASNRVTIGDLWTGTAYGSYPLKADLDEVAVWDTNLNSIQIAEIYNGKSGFGHPGDLKQHSLADNLKAWWRMGDDISVVHDSRGSNHGQMASHQDVVTDVLRRKDSLVTGSFQKANRNPLWRIEHGQPNNVTIKTVTYDNGHVTHPIPRADTQYKWIADSYQSSRTYGHATSSSDITFVSIGDVSVLEQLGTYSNNLVYEPVFAKEVNLPSKELNRGYFQDALILGVSSVANESPAEYPGTLSSYASTYNLGATPSVAADYFNVLMTSRNGLGGFSTWKQIRNREHPITRHLISNNYYTYTESEFVAGNSPFKGATAKGFSNYLWPDNIDPTNITNYKQKTYFVTEPPVSYNGSPITVEYYDPSGKYAAAFSFENELDTFANDVLLNALNAEIKMPKAYNIFLEGFKGDSDLQLGKFAMRNILYPRAVNVTLSKARGRLQYAELPSEQRAVDTGQQRLFWRDSLTNRLKNRAGSMSVSMYFPNSFGASSKYFAMPAGSLDVAMSLDIGASSIWPLDPNVPAEGYKAGELAQDSRLTAGLSPGALSVILSTPSQQYALSGTGVETQMIYEVDTQSGKKPWFDSYEEYAADIRTLGKGYTIIPEFKISDHMDYILSAGPDAELNNFLSLEGAGTSTSDLDSSAPSETSAYTADFFTTYVHSDFMKHFGQVRQDYEGLAQPSKMMLQCNVIKKLLPYQGFYPVTRCLQLGTLFSASHGAFLAGTSSLRDDSKYLDYLSAATQPLFAPGILYNTVKAGFGYGYPLFTGEPGFYANTSHCQWYKDTSLNLNTIKSAPSSSLRFEDLLLEGYPLNNTTYMTRRKVYKSGAGVNRNRIVGSNLKQLGSDSYVRAMHNFLAEVGNTFLENEGMGVFHSRDRANCGPLERGKTYYMDISVYKTPSMIQAEGPGGHSPSLGDAAWTRGSPYGFLGANWDAGGRPTIMHQDPHYALYTPPGFYGKESLTLAFTADEVDELMFPTFSKIASSASYEYSLDQSNYRDYMPGPLSTSAGILYDNRFKVDSCLDLFEMTRLEDKTYDAEGNLLSVAEPTSDKADNDVWAINTKFECPTLNFRDSASPAIGRGMWAQYGAFPTADEGIFFAIEESSQYTMQTETTTAGSLLQACGFDTTPKRIGDIASKKSISEAIVAIPFTLIKSGKNKGKKKFIKINKQVLNKQISDKTKTGFALPDSELVDTSITTMMDRLEDYVMPPNMDFIRNKKVCPFVVYLFEFKHDLSRQDLADIWQGVMPDISRKSEVDTSVLAHNLNKNEFFHGKPLPNDLRWMVFKIKRRAKNNYYNVKRASIDKGYRVATFEGRDREFDYSYNWPYDFFSLVELAQVESGVEFGCVKEDNLQTFQAADSCSTQGGEK